MAEVTLAAKELDERALQIVQVVLDRLGGGLGDLVKWHKSDMLASLTESAYILVLSVERHKSTDEIAGFLNLPPSAIRSVLEAPMEGVEERVRYVLDETHEFERHVDPEWSDMPSSGHLEPEYLTGALAKSAYTLIRREEGTIKSFPG
jgi:predicted transcriptional regulator